MTDGYDYILFNPIKYARRKSTDVTTLTPANTDVTILTPAVSFFC